MNMTTKEPSLDEILKRIRELRLGIASLNRAITLLPMTDEEKSSLIRLSRISSAQLRELSVKHSDMFEKSGKVGRIAGRKKSVGKAARRRKKVKALERMVRLPGSYGSNSK